MDSSGDAILTLKLPNDALVVWVNEIPVTEEMNSPSSTRNDVEQASAEDSTEQDMKEEKTASSDSVTFRVSSRHLILASPVFKAALTGGWKEADASNGELQISAEDWDTKAMTVVLNAIHGHYRRVPTMVTLEMLAKIAIIVDYYAVHEAMQLLGPIWIDHLRKSLPTTAQSKRDIASWICISWVFGDAGIFMHVTQVAIQHGDGDMTSLEFPIPSSVIGEIHMANH